MCFRDRHIPGLQRKYISKYMKSWQVCFVVLSNNDSYLVVIKMSDD